MSAQPARRPTAPDDIPPSPACLHRGAVVRPDLAWADRPVVLAVLEGRPSARQAPAAVPLHTGAAADAVSLRRVWRSLWARLDEDHPAPQPELTAAERATMRRLIKGEATPADAQPPAPAELLPPGARFTLLDDEPRPEPAEAGSTQPPAPPPGWGGFEPEQLAIASAVVGFLAGIVGSAVHALMFL